MYFEGFSDENQLVQIFIYLIPITNFNPLKLKENSSSDSEVKAIIMEDIKHQFKRKSFCVFMCWCVWILSGEAHCRKAACEVHGYIVYPMGFLNEVNGWFE